MKHIIPFDINAPGEATQSVSLPERRLEGIPTYQTWEIDASSDGTIQSGMWEATPGAARSIKGTTWEFCSILSGIVEISEEGGGTRQFKAGDVFVMKPGFVGVWKTIETVRKLWVTVTPAD